MAECSTFENGSLPKKRKRIDDGNDLYLFNNQSSPGIKLCGYLVNNLVV